MLTSKGERSYYYYYYLQSQIYGDEGAVASPGS